MTKNSIRLLLLQGFSFGIGFFSNLILVRVVGVSNYGSYVYIFNLLYLLAGFCILGVDTLLVKKVSIYDSEKAYGELKGVVIFSIGTAVVGTIIITALSGKIANITGALGRTGNINWFLLAFPALLMLTLSLVNQATLQGLKKIFLSQLTEKLIKPLLVVGLVLIFFYVKRGITLEELIWVNIIVIAIALLISSVLHQRSIVFKIRNTQPKYDITGWGHSTIAFFLLGLLYIFNARTGVFLLGLLKNNDSEIGVYNIALKISETMGFVLAIINYVLSPVIARLYSNNELPQLQKLITRSAQIVMLFSVPLLAAILFFKKDVLSFFGTEFLAGQTPLVILCMGQLVNLVCGSVGTLLIMTGYQRFSIISLAVSTVVNIVLNIILVPEYGMSGTALATAGSLVIWNCMMYFFVRNKINIRPTAFGVF